MFRRLTRYAALGVALFAQLQADTIELKDGTVFKDCRIIAEDANTVTASVLITKTIREEQVFKRELIAKIEKTPQDQLEWKKVLDKDQPTPQAGAQAYKDFISGEIDSFIAKYPQSSSLAAAKQLKEQYQKVLERLEAGDVELSGTWYTPKELERAGYAARSKQLGDKMQKDFNDGMYLDVLRGFDELQRDYAGSKAFAQSLDLLQKTVTAYQPILETALRDAKDRVEQRKKNLEGMNALDRKRAEEAIARDETAYKTQLRNEELAKLRWKSLSPYEPRQIEETLRLLTGETKRIESYQRTLERSKGFADDVLANFWKAVDDKDVNMARRYMSNLRSLRLSREYMAPLETRLEALNTEVKELEKAERQAKLDAQKQQEIERKEQERQQRLQRESERQQAKKPAGNKAPRKDTPSTTADQQQAAAPQKSDDTLLYTLIGAFALAGAGAGGYVYYKKKKAKTAQ